MLGHEYRIIISSTVTRRGEGSNPKRAAVPRSRYRLRVRRRRIITSAVLFLDSAPAGDRPLTCAPFSALFCVASLLLIW